MTLMGENVLADGDTAPLHHPPWTKDRKKTTLFSCRYPWLLGRHLRGIDPRFSVPNTVLSPKESKENEFDGTHNW